APGGRTQIQVRDAELQELGCEVRAQRLANRRLAQSQAALALGQPDTTGHPTARPTGRDDAPFERLGGTHHGSLSRQRFEAGAELRHALDKTGAPLFRDIEHTEAARRIVEAALADVFMRWPCAWVRMPAQPMEDPTNGHPTSLTGQERAGCAEHGCRMLRDRKRRRL